MARETLDRQRKLFDPVWGGVYQYSDSGDWDHPHFEKIMSVQADNLRLYAQAYAQWRDPRDLEAAQAVRAYPATFLRAPQGAFYTSQDADVVRGEHAGEYFAKSDAERRRLGLPRVDTHLYARENAWAVHALVVLHTATGDEAPLREALGAAEWIVGLGGGARRGGAGPRGAPRRRAPGAGARRARVDPASGKTSSPPARKA